MEMMAPSKVSLLYVEDDQATRELVARSLRVTFPDLEVLTATTGEEGLELSRAYSPPVIVTDIMVPGMNGMQMAREIRATNSRALIIATTAYSDSIFLLDAINVGVTHYLLKPLDLNELYQAVRESVARVKLEQQVSDVDKLVSKLSHVVEQNPSSVMIANDRGIIEYVNGRFLNETGYEAEDIVGQNLRFIFSEARPFDNYEIMWSTLRRGFHWRGQVLRRRKNGDFLFQDVCIFPLSGDDGTITNYVAVLDDVANRAEAKRVAPVGI